MDFDGDTRNGSGAPANAPYAVGAPVRTFAFPALERLAERATARIGMSAAVFGLLAWMYVAFEAYHSETRGIAASWIAVFPTSFGFAAVGARDRYVRQGRPATWGPLGWGLLWGLGAAGALWLFYATLWHAL